MNSAASSNWCEYPNAGAQYPLIWCQPTFCWHPPVNQVISQGFNVINLNQVSLTQQQMVAADQMIIRPNEQCIYNGADSARVWRINFTCLDLLGGSRSVFWWPHIQLNFGLQPALPELETVPKTALQHFDPYFSQDQCLVMPRGSSVQFRAYWTEQPSRPLGIITLSCTDLGRVS